MTEANKRTIQQQRIQQLQERLELYNAAAIRGEATSSVSRANTTNASGAATAAASSTSRMGGKPTRAPPPIKSPNPASHSTPVSSATESMFKSPLTASGGQNGRAPAAATAATTATSTTTAAVKMETSRISLQSQAHHQTPPAPPPPAPRLARNLAEDFVNSATTNPAGAPPNDGKIASPFITTNNTTNIAAGTGAASGAPTLTRAAVTTMPHMSSFAEKDAAAAAAGSASATEAAAPSATSPLRASDVFGYYNAYEEDEEEREVHHNDEGSEYMEYEVEDVEEYEEDDDDDYTEEESEKEGTEGEEEDHREPSGGPPPTLDNVLRRIFRAYSGSPDGHSTGLQPDRPVAASSPPAAHDPSLGTSSVTRVASAGANIAGNSASSSNYSLFQRAAELHRLHQAQQLHHSPFHTSDSGPRARNNGKGYTELHRDPADLDASSMSTSEASVELGTDTGSDLSTSSGGSGRSYLSPAAAYAALGIGHVTARAASASQAATAAAAASTRTGASPSSPATSSSSSAAPQLPANTSVVAAVVPNNASAASFDHLETAYRQLLLLQRGVEYAVERAGMQRFPEPLPHQEKAHVLAQQRNLLVQKDMELRAAPPGGASLEDVRRHEAATLEAAVAAIDARFASAIESAKPVIARGAAVEEKRRLLQQRELDLAQQREARIIVEREVAKMEDLLGDRKARLKEREADYNTQLQQHDEQQKAAQQQISEVEQLSKQVSSWLAILEERDRRLALKEKRLQRVQTDLIRRNEDVVVWKKAAQRVKQIPPPPSPPRIIN